MHVYWTHDAVSDLDEIIQYLRQQDLEYALRLIKTIRSSALTLISFPLKGREGRVADTREKIIFGSPYLIIYGIKDDIITTFRVIHSSQNYP